MSDADADRVDAIIRVLQTRGIRAPTRARTIATHPPTASEAP